MKDNYMRWKLVSTQVSEDQNAGIKTTTKTKQFVVSVGEVVGVANTAIGISKKAAGSFKGKSPSAVLQDATKKLKSMSLLNAALAPISAMMATLSSVVKSLDIYKKLMSVIEKITPIVQLAARASGMWCSPGNAGDIAQIVLGQVQKMLISLVIAGIAQLKDFIWNFEFPVAVIKESFEEPITRNLALLSEKINKAAIGESISNLANDSNESASSDSFISDISAGEIDLSNSIDWSGESDSKWFSDAYTTEFETGGFKRKLRGSIKNKGIQYSDDNGATWIQTKQLLGSWYCFAKVPSENGFTYVAGSKDFIMSLVESTDSDWQEEKNYYYSDGENFQTISKYQKETLEFDGKVKDTYLASKGIYYSLDNGITWKETEVKDNINHICEFEEKEGFPPTVVASSDDFNGCLYSENGKDWQRVYLTDKWFKIDAHEQDKKRITKISEIQNVNVFPLEVGTGNILETSIIVGYTPEIANLQVMDARSKEVIEYYDRMAELIAEGKSVDEIHSELGDI